MAKQTFTTGQVLTAAQMTSLQQTAMGGGSTTAKTASYTLVAADAGTVVQMNSASATTITVNTALFAAGDTVQIQNIGAGVCTITAGTATVNTSSTLALQQYDGGMLFFNSTSASFYFAFDAADSAASSAVACFAYKQATQSIPNATFTSVNWDAEWFDTNSIHSTSVNNDRFVVPAGKAGYYYLSAQIGWAGNATGMRQCVLYKNGSTQYSTPRIDPAVNATYNVTVSGIISCAVADYLSVSVYQTSGGALNTEGNALGNPFSFLSIMYLGA